MRVSFHIVQARRKKLADLIERYRYLSLGELCKKLGISEATARRDLNALAECNKLKRTHGGALMEYNDRFPSFNERRAFQNRSKRRIAKTALRLIQPGGTYFFDSGTTIFALAEAFRSNPVAPVTIVTSNLVVGELLSSIPDVQIFQIAGQVVERQSLLIGETACRSLEFWHFDIAFLSAEAANSEGIFSLQEIVINQQIVAIKRASVTVYCIDSHKIGTQAPFLLRKWPEVDYFLTDANKNHLSGAGIDLKSINIISCEANAPIPHFSQANKQQIPVHFL